VIELSVFESNEVESNKKGARNRAEDGEKERGYGALLIKTKLDHEEISCKVIHMTTSHKQSDSYFGIKRYHFRSGYRNYLKPLISMPACPSQPTSTSSRVSLVET